MNDSVAMSDSTATTEVAEQYLGNVNEDRTLQSQIALDRKQARCLEVFIDRTDARRGWTSPASGASDRGGRDGAE